MALQDGPLQGTPRSKEMGVYERLREQILSLELLPGERISERALEGRLSSSRTPIREALLRLEGEGLVVRDGRSQRVSPIEVAELLEVFEYREAIEAAAVGLACRRARPEQLSKLQQMLDRGLTDSSTETWFAIGADFHVSLAELSGNRFLTRAIQDVVTRIARARWIMARSSQGREEAHREHSEILRLIGEGQAEEAKSVILDHSRKVRDSLVASLREQQRSFRAHGIAVLD